MPLILNQYRRTSDYKDVVGERYHFPNRYLKPFGALPISFIYYEPREGGEQIYFGTGIVRSVVADTEDEGHSWADIDRYRPFLRPVRFHDGPKDQTWEPAGTMRNSVRRIDDELFTELLRAGGLTPEDVGEADTSFYEHRLERALTELRGRDDPLTLRKKRRIVESYERPSWVTNQVKRYRGDICQVCGIRGFVKRDGDRYCEIHHLFHLCENPPDECLGPDYVIVVCANCHRRLHYARTEVPVRTSEGWALAIDDEPVQFQIRRV